jgi:hypothetical protein
MPPLEPDDEEKKEKLDNDYDTPFSLPSDVNQGISDDNQVTDTNLDSHELYDAGISGAAGATDPLRKNTSDDDDDQAQPDPEEEGFDTEPNEDEV